MTEGPYFLVKSETLLPLMGSEMWQGEGRFRSGPVRDETGP